MSSLRFLIALAALLPAVLAAETDGDQDFAAYNASKRVKSPPEDKDMTSGQRLL